MYIKFKVQMNKYFLDEYLRNKLNKHWTNCDCVGYNNNINH